MVLDGETEKAVALRREIRKAERATLEYEMRQEMSQTVNQDRQMTALQQAANAMEDAYPVFNRDSDDYNEDMTNEVVELRDAFIMKGYEAVDALSKAALIINARVRLDPEDLESTVRDVLNSVSGGMGIESEIDDLQCFSPAYPEPPHVIRESLE